MKRRHDGQVLVIFALFLIVLLGFAALAIDVTGKYAAERHYRAVADAASLAGGQDLQITGTRTVTNNERTRARTDAMRTVLEQMIAPGTAYPSCPLAAGGTGTTYTSNVIDCPIGGGQLRVTIKTPALNCQTCLPDRAVQVTIREPSHNTSFAHLFGQSSWDLWQASVAGLTYSKSYALVTLRPPNFVGVGSLDQNANDVFLAGNNTTVNVKFGDIGTNSYVVTNSASRINLDPGYLIYHWDAQTPDLWNQSSGTPQGEKLTELITEPTGYTYPAPAGPTFTTQIAGEDTATNCTAALTGITLPYKNGFDPTGSVLKCYNPGIYTQDFNVGTAVNDPFIAYLKPGVYVFQEDVDINGYLFGGLQTSQGVTLVLNSNKSLEAIGAEGLVLNAGPSTCLAVACRATPALLNGVPVESPDHLPLTIMVRTNDTCFQSGTSPRLPILCTSDPASNTGTSVLKIGASSGAGGSTGAALIRIAGVIWAPTDNAAIASNYTDQQSYVGRIIVWSIKYGGGAALNQEASASSAIGILRIDMGCSPGEPCSSPFSP